MFEIFSEYYLTIGDGITTGTFGSALPISDTDPAFSRRHRIMIRLTIDDTYLLWVVLSYLPPKDLCAACRVSKTWNAIASTCEKWEDHCEELWRGKQNHPLERWALLVTPSVDHISEEEMHIRSQILCLTLLLLQSNALRNAFPIDATRTVEDIVEMGNILTVIQAKHAPQMAAPISTVIRYEQIQLENLLAGMDEGLDPEGCETVTGIIRTNMKTPVRVDAAAMRPYMLDGRLLDWKESYLASLRDSWRCWPSHEVINY